MSDLWQRSKTPARLLTIEQAKLELAELDDEWTSFRKALDEEGGMAGSPGEWMYDRMCELQRSIDERGQP